MPLGKTYRSAWRTAQIARGFVATAWWSTCYNAWIRLHPACEIAGWIKVTGRMQWRIHPASRVVIGRHVRINSGSLINAVGGHRPTVIAVLKGAELIIGDEVGVSSVTIACARQITIGRGALIGGDTCIYDSDFHSVDARERAVRPDPGAKTAAVAIGAEAFVGTGVTLLKGASIGPRAVVGAGAVVTGAVPADEIWAGNPARAIGRVPEGRASR